MKYLLSKDDQYELYNVEYDKDQLNDLSKKIAKEAGPRKHMHVYRYGRPECKYGMVNYNVLWNEEEFDEEDYRDLYIYDEILPAQLTLLIEDFIEHEDKELLDYIYGDKKLLSYKDDNRLKEGEKPPREQSEFIDDVKGLISISLITTLSKEEYEQLYEEYQQVKNEYEVKIKALKAKKKRIVANFAKKMEKYNDVTCIASNLSKK